MLGLDSEKADNSETSGDVSVNFRNIAQNFGLKSKAYFLLGFPSIVMNGIGEDSTDYEKYRNFLIKI